MERLVAREERVASLPVLSGILMRGFAAESGTGKERKRADSAMLNDFVGADKAYNIVCGYTICARGGTVWQAVNRMSVVMIE